MEEVTDWNRFGRGDTRGALRLITAEDVVRACHSVRTGQVISLNAPIEGAFPSPVGRASAKRTIRQHNQLRPVGDGTFVVVNDDNVEIALQGSSQWDSFAHFGVIEEGSADVFYGGAPLDETWPDARAKTLGMDVFGPGVVGRGVLVDIVGLVSGDQADTLPAGTIITRTMIEDALARQSAELQRGDIAMIYTGFFGAVRDNGGAVPSEVSGIAADSNDFWVEMEVAALVADNVGVEHIALGERGPITDYAVHRGVLRDSGIPLGELWELDELAAVARQDGRFDSLIVSVPLRLPGAFGSPANVVAIR